MRLGDIWRACVLGLAVSAAAHAAEPEVEKALEHASQRGEQIFRLDQSAWVSTDELRRKIPDLGKSGIQGWVVDPVGDRMLAIYYRLENGEPRAVFVAETRKNTVLKSRMLGEHDDARLTPNQVRMALAAQVARRMPAMRCTDGPINSVVIPPTAPDEPITVYMLSARVKADEFPFGGHQRFEIDKNGKVITQRAFSKSCLNMTPPRTPNREPAIAVVTHQLDTTPTEIHVFTSISMGRPVVVTTSDPLAAAPGSLRMWLVNGPTIRTMKMEDAGASD